MHADDADADRVWASVDARVDERRRDAREARLKKELEEYRRDNPKITEQFAALKRGLNEVSETDWSAIPEIGDYSIKRRRRENWVAAPDSLLDRARQESETAKVAYDDGGAGGSGTTTDLTAVGSGRGTVLGLKLDAMGDSVSGQTVVDPKGYLTGLSSMRITSDAEVSDIKKARVLLKSVTATNPKHAPGWIAAARLEEVAGKMTSARAIIQRGCDECPGSEDVWLEASRLQAGDAAKGVLAAGVRAITGSVKLWLRAAELEEEADAKRRVLRRALEQVPSSVRLWKEAVSLESEDDARVMLSHAVECCPQHVELWLALARLETYRNAKKVLNKARLTIPTEPAIWFTAAKLEEANDNASVVDKIIERGIKSLRGHGVVIQREEWMKEAEAAERAGSVATCAAIVRAVAAVDVEEEDMKRTWMADAEECIKRGSIETARAIYAHAITIFPGKKGVWLRAAKLEQARGETARLDELLRRAVTYCPQAEVLWLMGAKEKWLQGDVPAARAILQESFAANPDSEAIWLAAFKLEFENSEPERARLILEKARERTPTARVWLKSAIVEREMQQPAAELKLLTEGLAKFPGFTKMWAMLGQLHERQGRRGAAREAYAKGATLCARDPAVPMLWLCLAGLEERAGSAGKARAILEQGRARFKAAHNGAASEDLWLAGVRAERRAGNDAAAGVLLARALQELPAGGRLWAEAIRAAPRPQRKSKSADALKKADNDPYVVAAVAELFLSDRKVDKARNWLTRAVTLGPTIGDFWAALYALELQHGNDETRRVVISKCEEAKPTHGEVWTSVSKAVENAHLPTAALLNKAVVALADAQKARAAAAAAAN